MLKKYIEHLEKSERELNLNFKNKRHLFNALTHPSFANENKVDSLFEKYEFLGDSVLNFVITSYIFKEYPDYSEGELTVLRASLVNEEVLTEVSEEINIKKLLLLGKGVDSESLNKILVDALESIVGAIFLDKGIEESEKFIKNALKSYLTGKKVLPVDYKTKLQEITLKKLGILPSYKVVKEKGPVHRRKYFTVVEIKGKMRGMGEGRSKKIAEQEAAKEAIKKGLI